jgi:hypothetical protein
MKSKIVGILICMMLLAVVPIAAGIELNKEPQKDPAGLFDRTTVRGLVLFKRTAQGGDTIKFFALRLHYRTISLNGERESGIIMFQPVSIPNTMTGYYGHFFIMASFRGTLA